MRIGISGASGKTGYRIAEEALKKGYKLNLIVRKESVLPESLKSSKRFDITLNDQATIDESLKGCDALIIATGAKPSIDLTGPARIDALGVKSQIESCNSLGIKRVILVSSLCSGKLFHPLNLFGLILIWKRVGERALETSSLDWTVIRPGGLNENENISKQENIFYTSRDNQSEGSIPRRLVAKACIESLRTKSSIKRIIEITSNSDQQQMTMENAIKAFNMK